MTSPKSEQLSQPTMLSFVRDLPNVCSLVGLLCALLAVYYTIRGNFPAAILGIIWAVCFDWGDGMIARRMQGRTDEGRTFGGQLDSLIDMVSFGVFPAVLLLSIGKFNPWFLPGAFLILAACAIRLSYFNVFGLNGDSTYMGMAVDNNAIILSFFFLFDGFFNRIFFSAILYAVCLFIAALNVAPIRTPKFSEKWFYLLILYALILTVIYSFRL